MIVVDHLESISTKYEFSATVLEPLVQTCRTTLSSKIKATGLWGVVQRPLDGDMQGGEGDVQGGDSAWRRRFWAASGAHSALLCRAAREPCREATGLLGGVLCGG